MVTFGLREFRERLQRESRGVRHSRGSGSSASCGGGASRAAFHELSKVEPEACGTVWNVIRSRKVSAAGRNVAVYLDCVMNLEGGVEFDGQFDGYGEVVASTLPGGMGATAADTQAQPG